MPKLETLTRGRYGDWIQTYTGRKFWPLDPEPDDIDIEDIAHALSLICRFNGHCTRFYSVAQHSVLVAALSPGKRQLEGLMHDAAEAYLADIPRPVKHNSGGILDAYIEAERRLERVIADRFRLRMDDGGWPLEVKDADDLALAIEKRDVMAPEPAPWGDLPDPSLYQMTLASENWTPEYAKHMFLDTFRVLGGDEDDDSNLPN